MGLRLVIVSSLLLLGILNCTAQKFCNHLRLQEQMAMNNTIDTRADTFNVISYTIDASFLDYQNKKNIDAGIIIVIEMLEDASSVTLDLLDLNVSDIKVDAFDVTYDYTSPKITIPLTAAKGDTVHIKVDYSGQPKSDPQWGGFYFTGEYAFNLGVGFASNPHNFGRVWFPCFDNFTDRALYYTNITVDSGKSAYANGYLTHKIDNGDKTTTFKWTMDEPIPTYLASVAIADYEEVKMNVEGIPVLLTSLAADTSNLRSSFENIPECIKSFEKAYGDHSFDRVGFNIVPFNAGAMEHATNIAYPRYAIEDGGKEFETLFAHELAHHWWGNTITCRTQEDMWLNEGWASYSERIFLEAVYGRSRYEEDIEANHRQVLQFAHVQDGAALPVSGIGHANTYGRHVYNKGADMVHTLRGMMGDSAFFKACASFQQVFKFKDVSTEDMRKHFQLFTPLDLYGFFSEWVEKPGFPHFDILYTLKTGDKYGVKIKQTNRFTTETYTRVIAKLTAFSKDFERHDAQVIIMNKHQEFIVDVPFEPVFWSFDFDDLISDAVTTDWAILKGEDNQIDMPQGMMDKVRVLNNGDMDSVLVRIEHHWAPADGTFGLPDRAFASRQRYWTVDGIWDENVQLSSQLIYSGLQTNSADFGYLDHKLIRITEDSLVLLYRPDAYKAWELATDYTKNIGSKFDKRGTIDIANLKKGQYTLGMYDANLASVAELPKANFTYKMYPNPVEEELIVEFQKSHGCCTLEITNLQGQVVHTEKLKKNKTNYKIDVSKLASGTYFLGVITKGLAYDIRKFVKE